MRPAVFLVLLVGLVGPLGCASLLGIENPQPRSDGGPDGAGSDADDGGSPAQDHLAFSVVSLRLARNQTARVHVLYIHADASTEDVTATAAYSSDDPAIAIPEPGKISAGAQAGSTIITASLANVTQAKLPVTVASVDCHPVINELMAGGVTAAEEWVEIYNGCTGAIDVGGWTLNYRGANAVTGPDNTFMVALIGMMAPGEIRLYAGQDYLGASDGTWNVMNGIIGMTNGSVGLRMGPMSTAPLVDSIAYGNVAAGHPFTEGTPASALANGRSAARLPFDGRDDGDGATDFTIVLGPTPRAPNAP